MGELPITKATGLLWCNMIKIEKNKLKLKLKPKEERVSTNVFTRVVCCLCCLFFCCFPSKSNANENLCICLNFTYTEFHRNRTYYLELIFEFLDYNHYNCLLL